MFTCSIDELEEVGNSNELQLNCEKEPDFPLFATLTNEKEKIQKHDSINVISNENLVNTDLE